MFKNLDEKLYNRLRFIILFGRISDNIILNLNTIVRIWGGDMLDAKDMKILEILMKEGRKPFTEIAKELNTSESSIRKRVRKMEEEGVIKGYTAVIDPSKIGYNVVALTGFDTDPQNFLMVAKKLCEFEEVKKVYTSTGDHMIMAEIWAKDGQELTNIIFNKIGKIEGIKKVCPAIILEQLK